MSTYVITQVVTYKPANRKAEDAANFALQLKHRIITGKSPVTDLLRGIEDHCRFLNWDRDYWTINSDYRGMTRMTARKGVASV